METSKCKKTIWQVPTASGKTTVACSYDFNKFGSDSFGFFGYTKIHKENSIFIYTAPLTTIIEDLKEHYPNFQVVCEGHINAHAAKFVDTIITYNSLPTFLKRLKDNDLLKDVVLVVDEIHEVVQSSGYQNIAEMQSIFNQVSHVVGMSATISNIQECFNDFNILRCERKDNPVVNINLHIVEESKVLDTIMKCSIDSKDDNVLIFRNSKKIGSKSNVFQINEALKQEGINSDVLTGGMRLEEKRNNKAYQSLIKTNRLPKDCNFLVSTSVLSTGVTAYVDKIIYVATRTRDITAFMQSYARDRSDNIEVELILVREKTAKKDLPINLDITSIFERCQASARLANKSKLANDFIYKEHPELKEEPKTFLPNNLSDEIKKFVYFDRFTDKFEVNRYKIFNERYKDFCNNMSTDTYIKLIQELVPNCTIVEVKDDTIYENSEQVAEILVHQKELLASDTTSLKTIMKDDGKGNPVAENVFHTTDNDKVKESVKTYSYISSFLNVGAKKGYVLNADLLNPKPKIDSDLEIELCAMIEKRMELERKISVSKSDKSIKTYTKQLSKLQDKLDTKTKQSEYLRQFENEPLINVVKRNFEHLQVFFLRFKALKNALKDAIPFEMLVDICMDTNRTNYGTLLKQLYHNAAIEAYDLAKLNTKKLKQDDSFFEQKMESIEFDLKVIKFVSKKECSVNDFLNKFRGDAYTEKNLKRKLSVLFTDIDISTLYICAKRLDLAQLIGEENKDKYLNNFKNSL
jgi:chorismate mutase